MLDQCILMDVGVYSGADARRGCGSAWVVEPTCVPVAAVAGCLVNNNVLVAILTTWNIILINPANDVALRQLPIHQDATAFPSLCPPAGYAGTCSTYHSALVIPPHVLPSRFVSRRHADPTSTPPSPSLPAMAVASFSMATGSQHTPCAHAVSTWDATVVWETSCSLCFAPCMPHEPSTPLPTSLGGKGATQASSRSGLACLALHIPHCILPALCPCPAPHQCFGSAMMT